MYLCTSVLYSKHFGPKPKAKITAKDIFPSHILFTDLLILFSKIAKMQCLNVTYSFITVLHCCMLTSFVTFRKKNNLRAQEFELCIATYRSKHPHSGIFCGYLDVGILLERETKSVFKVTPQLSPGLFY